MDSDAESQGPPSLTILSLCDRLQDILINDGFDDLVVTCNDQPVTTVWVIVGEEPGERKVVLM